jgi:hypothetical protein
MLDNYTAVSNGVIQQISRDTFKYDQSYVKQSYLHSLVENMSYLRLGYILGNIPETPRSLLDVGYGSGSFLQISSQIIKDTYGHDINGYPIPATSKFVENIQENYYDIITFFDSLEHFPDIYFLDKLKCKYICISVPWCHYFSDEWFATWKHRKPNEHLWHFNSQSLRRFMDSQGYDVINIGNFEDTIRKIEQPYANILSGVFVNRNPYL